MVGLTSSSDLALSHSSSVQRSFFCGDVIAMSTSCCELSAPFFQVWTKFFWSKGTNFWSPRPKFSLDQISVTVAIYLHFNLKGSSIPTISELLWCSFRSCHARLTDGRCSSFIRHFEHLPSVNLVWHDLKLQHSSSDTGELKNPSDWMWYAHWESLLQEM